MMVRSYGDLRSRRIARILAILMAMRAIPMPNPGEDVVVEEEGEGEVVMEVVVPVLVGVFVVVVLDDVGVTD